MRGNRESDSINSSSLRRRAGSGLWMAMEKERSSEKTTALWSVLVGAEKPPRATHNSQGGILHAIVDADEVWRRYWTGAPEWSCDAVNSHSLAAATLRRACNQGEEVPHVEHYGHNHPSRDCKGRWNGKLLWMWGIPLCCTPRVIKMYSSPFHGGSP